MSTMTERATGTILLCAATVWEAEPLARALGLRPLCAARFEGTVGGRNVALAKIGAGPAAAAASLSKLGSAEDYEMVISVGLAGALQPGMASGDLVLDIQGADSELPPAARELATELGIPFHFGRIIHSDEVLADPLKKRTLGQARRASAVDMESGPIRDWASRYGVPSLTVRVVLDGIEDRIPAAMPKGEDFGSLVRYVLGDPSQLPLLLSTGLRSRKAVANLGRFLERFLPLL